MNPFTRWLSAVVMLLGVGLVVGGMVARLAGGTGVDNRPALAGIVLVGAWVVARVVAGRKLDLPTGGGAGRAVGHALVLALGLLLAVYPSRAAIADRVQAVGDGKPAVDVREPAALEAAVAALSDRAGHRQAVKVTISPAAVWARMPVEPGERWVRLWGYQSGEVTEAGRGNDALQTFSADAQFSMDEVAWEEILPAVERARAEFVTENGEEPAGGSEIHVQRVWGDGARNGPVRVDFGFVGDGRWHYSMAADGSGLARDQG